MGGRKRKNPTRKAATKTARRSAAKRSYRKRMRRNPKMAIKKLIPTKDQIMMALTGGAGIVAGSVAMPMIYKVAPQALKDNRKYLGVIHVLLGAAMASLLKGRNAKTFGGALAATGVYDLVAMNIPQLGLPGLPSASTLSEKLLPSSPAATVQGSYQSLPAGYGSSYPVLSAPVSRVASAGYMGASYNAPDMRTEGFGMDSPFADIEGYE